MNSDSATAKLMKHVVELVRRLGELRLPDHPSPCSYTHPSCYPAIREWFTLLRLSREVYPAEVDVLSSETRMVHLETQYETRPHSPQLASRVW